MSLVFGDPINMVKILSLYCLVNLNKQGSAGRMCRKSLRREHPSWVNCHMKDLRCDSSSSSLLNFFSLPFSLSPINCSKENIFLLIATWERGECGWSFFISIISIVTLSSCSPPDQAIPAHAYDPRYFSADACKLFLLLEKHGSTVLDFICWS